MFPNFVVNLSFMDSTPIETPWVEYNDYDGSLRGNAEGFEALRESITILLDSNAEAVPVLEKGIFINRLCLLSTPTHSPTLVERVVGIIGCMVIAILGLAGIVVVSYLIVE